ncbi:MULTISPECIES: hypothetical protein [Cyanophyceae]|uniref:hypothetical protein n=1 Tax=Cyanophyceae TaxID=3028117 RepID=UPI0016859F89|nr:hypothetical protein [Trichocoleus sp. FACHB-832]MBD1904102.1 hypothetical protein [Trichocoleus sp. FACHB-832]
MLNGQVSKKILRQWIIVNTVSLPVSLAIFLVFNWRVYAIQPRFLEYNVKSTILNTSFAVVGAVVGLVQWLLLKREVSRISGWWLLTNIPGLYVATIVSAVFLAGTMSTLFHRGFSGSAQILVGGAVSGAVGGAVGGAITGITQSLLLARRVLVRNLWIIWILSSTVAWAVSWAVGLSVGFYLGAAASDTVMRPDLSEQVSYAVFGVIFGTISGFLNGAITGRILIWAMLKSRFVSTSSNARDI